MKLNERRGEIAGTIRIWKDLEGYGFVRAESGNEYFFHLNNVDDFSNGPILPGQIVAFRIGISRRDKPVQAINLHRLGTSSNKRRQTRSWRA